VNWQLVGEIAAAVVILGACALVVVLVEMHARAKAKIERAQRDVQCAALRAIAVKTGGLDVIA
jgi:hypothetical protein